MNDYFNDGNDMLLTHGMSIEQSHKSGVISSVWRKVLTLRAKVELMMVDSSVWRNVRLRWKWTLLSSSLNLSPKFKPTSMLKSLLGFTWWMTMVSITIQYDIDRQLNSTFKKTNRLKISPFIKKLLRFKKWVNLFFGHTVYFIFWMNTYSPSFD